MDPFLENAQKLFDVARADRSGEHTDFALLVRPDGGLHLIMETPFALDSVAAEGGARVAYRVTRSACGVRVTGQNGAQQCVLRETGPAAFRKHILQDHVLYSLVPASLAGAETESSRRARAGELASTIPHNI